MVCTKCGAEMINANFNASVSGAPPYLSIKGGVLQSEKRCGIECHVCLECGKIELVAQNPEKSR